MNRTVTLDDVQEAVDQLVADGLAKVIQPCVVSVPDSWRNLLPESAFDRVEPLYQTAHIPTLMKKALEDIHSISTQSWIRAASREALAELHNCKSDAEMESFAKRALTDIDVATSDRMVKTITKPFLN